jgi:hypothetical protein
MMAHPQPEWIAEDDLAAALGMDREKLRLARATLPPEDVDLDGPWVVWKKSAATAWAADQGLQFPMEQKPTPELLRVASKSCGPQGYHFPNRRIIKALRPNGELVTVRVADSSKYVERLRNGQPMEFLAIPSRHGAEWVLVGREPRYRGGW